MGSYVAAAGGVVGVVGVVVVVVVVVVVFNLHGSSEKLFWIMYTYI